MTRTRAKRVYSGSLTFNEAATDLSSDLEDQTAVEPERNDTHQLIVWAASLELEAVGLRRNSEILRQHVMESCESLNEVLEEIRQCLSHAVKKSDLQKANRDIMARLRSIERQIETSEGYDIKDIRDQMDLQHRQMMKKMDEILKKQNKMADAVPKSSSTQHEAVSRPTTTQNEAVSRPATRQIREPESIADLEAPRTAVTQSISLGPPRTPKRPPVPQSFLQPSWSEPPSPQRTPSESPRRPSMTQSFMTTEHSWSSGSRSRMQRGPSEPPSPRRVRPAPPDPFAEIERVWSQFPVSSEPVSPKRARPTDSFAMEWPLLTDSQQTDGAHVASPSIADRFVTRGSPDPGRSWSAQSVTEPMSTKDQPAENIVPQKRTESAMEPPQIRKSARLRMSATDVSTDSSRAADSDAGSASNGTTKLRTSARLMNKRNLGH